MRRLLVPVLGGAVAGVSWLADSAREHDGPSRMDPTTAAQVLRIRTPTLTDLAQALTFVGSEVSVGLLAMVVLVVLVVRRELDRATVLAVGIGGSAFLTVAIKLLVARHRPGGVDRLGALDTSYSFPSGHTLNSTVLIALGVWLLWPKASRAARGGLVAGGAVLALGVAASRVYLGYHWLTDVIASALIAVAWLSILVMLRDPVQHRVSRLSSSPAET
jgi:membrane-associated phospholipid phosphatase